MTIEQTKLCDSLSGIPVRVGDKWKTTSGVVEIIGPYKDLFVAHHGRLGLLSFGCLEFHHPTRFNNLTLTWNPDWPYPVAEVDGVKNNHCVVKLPGLKATDCAWPLGFGNEWYWETDYEVDDSRMYACHITDWCPTCHKPKAACPCKEMVDACTCENPIPQWGGFDGMCNRCRKPVVADHSTDAGKKVEDESSILNLIRNQSNLIDNLITRVAALEESK